jgi:uncharacterized membrane protein
MTLFLAFLIGFFAGLRSLAPPAVTAWAVHLGWLKLHGPLALIGSAYSVTAFTVLALGELAADKWWAKIPDRTSLPALMARVASGALMGACVAVAAGGGLVPCAALGGLGGIAGAFAGFHARRRLVRGLGLPDFPVAVIEDGVAIGGCLWIVTRFG